MVQQKLIFAKIDEHQLELFDKLCDELHIKRNRMFNFLVWYANNQISMSTYNLMVAYSRCSFDDIENDDDGVII